MPLISGIFPSPGQVLICDFGPEPAKVQPPGLLKGPLGVAPEMYKERHCVVISAWPGLTTIVPFSTQAPRTPQKWHHRIPAGRYPFFDPSEDNWAKSDLIGTVSNERLDRPYLGGTRRTVKLDKADFAAIRETVLHAVGLSRLTPALRDLISSDVTGTQSGR